MSTETDHISTLSAQLGQALQARGWKLATAESCTGGGIAAAVTEIPGSSAWFECGVVSYSNVIKQQLLSVPASHFDRDGPGAVSEETVLAMAANVLKLATADCSVAVSGVAGPDGGSAGKPVGTVWIAWADRTQVQARRFLFPGDRQAVRLQTVAAALAGMLEVVNTGQ